MATPHAAAAAAVVGAGIGGLAAAAALHRRGWRVDVCERAQTLEPVGAGIALAPNALRALDTIDAGDALRAHAAIQGRGGIRHPRGGWMTRTDTGAVRARFGDPVLAVHRAELVGILADLLPADRLHLGTEAVAVDEGGPIRPARLSTNAGELTADAVIVADGISSSLRAGLFPSHPGVRYAGYTSWRMVVPDPGVAVEPSETWGRGARFGIVPLAKDRVYCFATADSTPGQRYDDDHAELVRRFGDWHAPIPALLAGAGTDAVLHHDIEDLAAPLRAFHLGRVALLGDAAHATTPNLGQGGCLALEDAVVLAHLLADGSGTDVIPDALAGYTAVRRPRALEISRRSRRVGEVAQWSSPLAVAGRNLVLRVSGLLPDAVTARALDPVVGWSPP
ncbi:MAG: FAD-dependent monooxygenase [Streptosporangiaceae bacterium]